MKNNFIFGSLLAGTAALSGHAVAKDKSLPSSVRIITADQAKLCTFLDVVSAMRFAMVSASKTQRDALIAALLKAQAAGANAAVITGMTADHNQHQVTLTAYKCPLVRDERG